MYLLSSYGFHINDVNDINTILIENSNTIQYFINNKDNKVCANN